MNPIESGMINRRRILGDAWVDKSLSEANALTAEFQMLITRRAWDEVWGRNHAGAIDDKTRRMLVLAMTLGMGRYEEFGMHVKSALSSTNDTALTIDTIKEIVFQGAVYCGVPAANTAMHVIADVLKSQNAMPPALHVVRSGEVSSSKSTVVLSHALGFNCSMWDGIIPELAKQFNVIAYDHRGQGGSEKSATDFSIDALVDDAAAVIIREVFAKGGGPVHFVGLSMGGMVAQALAARYPHLVKSIVVANSAMRYDDAAQALWRGRIETVKTKGMSAIIDLATTRWFTPEFRAANPSVIERVTAILLANEPTAYARSCAAISTIDFRRSNASIQSPALVIAGEKDVSTVPALSADIAASIKGAKLVSIDAAHVSVVERPSEFLEHCLPFFVRPV
ncbi:MAG: alpha/beta fold hydrolase [Burkholderiales bacterium]|nr:MAG: alpha/beta fold hydrolase [Betaproteobacteria bacterium]TAG24784.1 MAG: alpha/beta fold hydrolase [Burkholderiales bacterium]TAG47895.1 MAG: alpha/beta fold hydrolase [Betaproteobacteria bacterium]